MTKLRETVDRLKAWWRTSPRLTLIRLFPTVGGALTAVIVVLIVAAPLLSLGFTLASGRLVGNVAGAVGGGLDSEPGRRVVAATVALGVVFVLQHVVGGVTEVLSQVAARRLDRKLNARVLDATLSPAGIAHVEDPEVLDKIAVTRGETTGFTAGSAAAGLVQVAVNRILILPPFFLLAAWRWWLPIVHGLALAWMRFAMRRHILQSIRAFIGQTTAMRRADYFVDLALLPAAAKETRIFGLGRFLVDRYGSHYLAAMAVVWRERAQNRLKLAPPLVLTLGFTGLGYVLVARAGASGAIDLERTVVLLGAVSGMSQIVAIGNEDVSLEHGAALLPEIVEVEKLMRARRASMGGDASPAGMPREIVRFEGVGFRYPRTDRDIYQSIDLELRAGESLAIVGLNGAGKTTLVKLLARLYDPTSGRITVDGVDLRELDPDAWQRRVAAIFQDFTKYELSAADNVGLGSLGLREDRDALVNAAERAGAAAIIEGLPKGWDTTLSRRFTEGADLSGGEWQRVALARALLAVQGGAGILVLDEPTANLDVRAEAQLYERFLDLTREVTTVVISHRFSTVRRADRIVVIDEGRVVEQGTHDELLALGGQYARMFHLQASRFGEDDVEDGGDGERDGDGDEAGAEEAEVTRG